MSGLNKLSPEEKQALLAEARELVKNEDATIKAERKKFKEIVSNEVAEQVERMKNTVNLMKDTKIEIYNSLQTLVTTKAQVFDTKQNDQNTHTFTTDDGKQRIILGKRDISAWDGTESAGVAKVQEYLATLAKDSRSAELVKMVQGMLKPDKKGMLDARRIIELSKVAEEGGNELFMDGINIILNAYKVVGSKMFLEAYEKDAHGAWQNINLNFSEIKLD